MSKLFEAKLNTLGDETNCVTTKLLIKLGFVGTKGCGKASSQVENRFFKCNQTLSVFETQNTNVVKVLFEKIRKAVEKRIKLLVK